MNEMPEVKLFLGRVGDYALTGFPEFDEFATRNDPTWSAIRKRCFYSGVSEEVRMKLTAAELLKQNIELRRKLVEMTESGTCEFRAIPTRDGFRYEPTVRTLTAKTKDPT